ncbi:MAG: MotA/TolQ/ExbB proton channel family protein [Acidobacteriota bacterium]|nr:MotA/TolQ/ExbB proton channel family protein [Acidobacteriota bacterium]
MPKKGLNFLLFVVALILTALFYGILTAFFKPGAAYQFFSSRGWYQPVSLAFFFFGLLLAGARWWLFREEQASIDMPIPNTVMSRDEAAVVSDQIPQERRNRFLGRRVVNLLKGYVRREELGPLEDRLAMNDRDELDASASLIGWVRSLPPLVGLLGTLDGLRGGIAEISMISNAGDLEELRRRLQLFAAHASTAFDTTLLGISAAAILSAIIFLVRKNEDTHLVRIDRIATELTRQFPHRTELEEEIRMTANGFMSGFMQTMEHAMAGATPPMVDAFRREMQDGMQSTVQGLVSNWQRDMNANMQGLVAMWQDGMRSTMQDLVSSWQEGMRATTQDLVSHWQDGVRSTMRDVSLNLQDGMHSASREMVANWRDELSRATTHLVDRHESRPLQIRITTDRDTDRDREKASENQAYEVQRA